jgi:two-component system, OmpR family, sensor histidine kinase ChvG
MSVEAEQAARPQAPARPSRVSRAALVRSLRLTRAMHARLSSSLARRIVVLNLGGLVALLAGFLYLNQFRESMIDARIQSLATQGAIIAAAIAASATPGAEDITVDPEKLLRQPPDDAAASGRPSGLQFSLSPEVGPLLQRLVSPTGTRARIYDRDGYLLLDSRTARLTPRTGPPDDRGALEQGETEAASVVEQALAKLRRWMRRPGLPLYRDIGMANGKAYPEVEAALAGKAQAVVRANVKGETIISVAAPVQRFHSVRGALLLSTVGEGIDKAIAMERWAIIRIFLVSAGVMLLLSLLFAGAIAEPMRRLAEAAERVRRGVKSRQEIPDFTDRQDEIGHLSGALRDMTKALYNRIEAIEHFAADVSHELKNPLTSLRSAVETLPIAKTEGARERLLEIIKHDVGRLDRLISDISDASRLDAELARADMMSVDLSAVLTTVVDMAQGVENEDEAKVTLSIRNSMLEPRRDDWRVQGNDSRLAQVFDNIIANARSFSPPLRGVRVTLRPSSGFDMSGVRRDGFEILVDDDGPGIPEGAFERVFERFYTDRPQQGFGHNSGLGLSISRQIVEAHNGKIRALNRTTRAPEGTDRRFDGDSVLGARFVIWLPGQE